MTAGAGAERMRAHRGERALGLRRGHDRDEPALVGEIQRIEAEDLAEALDLFARSARAASSISMPHLRRSAISLSTVATPPRVASRMKRVPGAAASSASTRPCSGAQSLSIGASSARSPRAARIAAPWSPSTPLTSTASPGRARCAPSSSPARITPMPVVVRNSLSQAPRWHHLGVAGHDLHAGLARRRGHRSRDAAQQVDRQAFLDDRGAGQIERDRAADRQVVDRAAHGQLADVAAGKHQRIDHERVGGERQPVAVLAPAATSARAPDRRAAPAADCRTPRRTRRRSGPSSPCRRRRGSVTVGMTRPVPSCARLAHASVRRLVVGGAGALGRHHQRAERRLRRAGGAEHLALPRLQHALQHLAALAGLADRRSARRAPRTGARRRTAHRRRGTGRRNSRSSRGRAIRRTRAVRRPCRSRAAPPHCRRRRPRARTGSPPPRGPRRSAAAPSRSTAARRAARSPTTTSGLSIVPRDELVGRGADHHRHVAGPEEAVDPQIGAVEDRLDRRHDRDVVAEHREVADALALRLQHRQRGGRHRGLEAEPEEHHLAVRVLARERQRVRSANTPCGCRRRWPSPAAGSARTRHAHGVAERGEDHAGLRGDGDAVVDAAHRQHAHRTAGAVHQFDLRPAACPRCRSGRSRACGRRTPP